MKHYIEAGLLAEKIVNTRDTTRAEPEYLRTPADLAEYVRSWNILLAQQPTAQDLAEVLDLRGRLRAVFEARDTAAAVALLNHLLQGVRTEPYVELMSDRSIELHLKVEERVPLAR